MINFDLCEDDKIYLGDILDSLELAGEDRTQISMSMRAANNHGCPIDFARLAAADQSNQAHDAYGIHRHINKETGEIEGHFLPRYRLRKMEGTQA